MCRNNSCRITSILLASSTTRQSRITIAAAIRRNMNRINLRAANTSGPRVARAGAGQYRIAENNTADKASPNRGERRRTRDGAEPCTASTTAASKTVAAGTRPLSQAHREVGMFVKVFFNIELRTRPETGGDDHAHGTERASSGSQFVAGIYRVNDRFAARRVIGGDADLLDEIRHRGHSGAVRRSRKSAGDRLFRNEAERWQRAGALPR